MINSEQSHICFKNLISIPRPSITPSCSYLYFVKTSECIKTSLSKVENGNTLIFKLYILKVFLSKALNNLCKLCVLIVFPCLDKIYFKYNSTDRVWFTIAGVNGSSKVPLLKGLNTKHLSAAIVKERAFLNKISVLILFFFKTFSQPRSFYEEGAGALFLLSALSYSAISETSQIKRSGVWFCVSETDTEAKF